LTLVRWVEVERTAHGVETTRFSTAAKGCCREDDPRLIILRRFIARRQRGLCRGRDVLLEEMGVRGRDECSRPEHVQQPTQLGQRRTVIVNPQVNHAISEAG
jgi:hypothetical protein